ncbi:MULTISPECIES: UDP-N-acetylmuramate dehydrogenase [Shewanella]|uniref:UDP-N-acetylenolpyruvoylglucosamine reductase n=1 Tax=Shewanella metallivivens TaxID=2872342 RepID=A0ABT5TPC8_9GAMM|nr:UDP-N-acetylmuramate dehydrogenase [Shewanella metallivivens]MDD8060478.1 UDP-N-acetylmuramate dehydrogenase [Shewanella metallivivens]
MSISLKPFNTFGLQQNCLSLINVDTKSDLISTCDKLYKGDFPLLILGGGSNLIFTENYQGSVVKVSTKGIEITSDDTHYYLTVQAGENWHQLVEFCLARKIYGLENMALIPGTVGAAPIQNIGAYGVEFNLFCHQVEFWRLDTEQLITYSNEQCEFDYRESVFKQRLKNLAVITQVTLKLAKHWVPVINYGPLQHFDLATVTARDIFECVCHVRQAKLPDPTMLGNVGSFFKNPVIPVEHYNSLKASFSNLIAYEQADGQFKLAAGWLIDQAGLKGVKVGGAAVHQDQALVLVNLGNANGSDVCQLARKIINAVYDKFSVVLHPEPRVIGSQGEIDIK